MGSVGQRNLPVILYQKRRLKAKLLENIGRNMCPQTCVNKRSFDLLTLKNAKGSEPGQMWCLKITTMFSFFKFHNDRVRGIQDANSQGHLLPFTKI